LAYISLIKDRILITRCRFMLQQLKVLHYLGTGILSISLCLKMTSYRAQPISSLDDPIKPR